MLNHVYKILYSWLLKKGLTGCPACCVMSQKSTALVYFAAGAWNHSLDISLLKIFTYFSCYKRRPSRRLLFNCPNRIWRRVQIVHPSLYSFLPPRYIRRCRLNLLKPTGHVTHQQFNIQQLCVLPTLYLCVLYLSENKQRLVPLIA